MRGLLRSWSGLLLVSAVAACSNIIGLSEIEIDPALDGVSASGASAEGGNVAQGGKEGTPTGGNNSLPEAGEPGTGGAGRGGSGGSGNAASGTAGGGGVGAAAGETAIGGETSIPPGGCRKAADCDDTIDCTVDTCGPDQECVHAPDHGVCDAHECESCQVGIGCVAGETGTKQVLLDPGFDAPDPDGWIEWATGTNILADASALSAPNSAQLGPAAADATKYLYGEVYQYIDLPEKLVSLSLTLSYKFTVGVRKKDLEYVVAALYEEGEVEPFTQFHEFPGTAAAQPTWKQVTYAAPQKEVDAMAGKDFSFSLSAQSWDGIYRFDNVQLNATYCQ